MDNLNDNIETDITDYRNIPRSGIIAVIIESSKKVYITQGSSLRTLVGRNINEIEDGVHKCVKSTDQYRMIVLEGCYDKESRMLHTEYWKEYYRNIGYEVLSSEKSLLKYKISKRVYEGKVEVSLVDSRYARLVVGLFKKMYEAERFIETCYGDSNPFKLPVYAVNELTKENCKIVRPRLVF